MKNQASKPLSRAKSPKSHQDPKVKAALILLSIGEDLASDLLGKLPKKDVLNIARVMQRLTPGSPELNAETITSAIDEFLEILAHSDNTLSVQPQSFVENIKKKLPPTLEQHLSTSSDWTTPAIRQLLERIPLAALITFTVEEHPQTVTLILAHLAPEKGAKLIKALPEQMRLNAIVRLASLDLVNPSALEDLEETLRNLLDKTNHLSNHGRWEKGQGTQKIAEMLSRTDAPTRVKMLEALSQKDPLLHQEVTKKMFQFSDLLRISPSDLSKILPQINQQKLVFALKGCTPNIINHLLGAMSPRTAQRLREDLAMLPPIRVTEMAAAQDEILKLVKGKIDSGECELTGEQHGV